MIDDFGQAHTAFSGKPNEAIAHLLSVKHGHVPAAIHKDGIGHIDFVYGCGGERGFGLAHIIERRNEQGVDGEEFVRNLPNIIESGTLAKQTYPDRMYVANGNDRAIVKLDYDGQRATWLVTAFPHKKTT
ncbi:MAG: hypothetical protein FWB76_04425 [Oscillospiraceae bacterium]|nr:hypothetical protein [Oscillospiraceae bacterium]